MKNIIITGSSGMVGALVLQKCLNSNDVNKVTSIVRKSSGIKHPKLNEIVHANFLDYSEIGNVFKDQDIAFYCIGVYTGAVPRDEFRKITVDYTVAFAKMLRSKSDKTTFCFLSGQGADKTEKSKMMFAVDKGIAENALQKMKFSQFYTLRPGYIYPSTPRIEPNVSYKIMKALYKPISKIYPNIGISSEDLASAMVMVGRNGSEKSILENKDIRSIIGLV
jgi:nucleoside-diphosphate-sugar epimerase